MSATELIEVITSIDITIFAAVASTLATVIIAIFTGSLFCLQKRQHQHDKIVANTNLKLTLFERRMRVVDAVRAFLNAFLEAGEPKVEKIPDLDLEVRYAKFLFPEHVTNWIEELRTKAIVYKRHYNSWDPLRARSSGGEKLDADTNKKKEEYLDAMRKIEKWFLKQVEDNQLTAKFEPYVKLPNEI